MVQFFTILLIIAVSFKGYMFFSENLMAAKASVAEENVVNVYSSRKEKLTEELFKEFERDTAIKVNFVVDKAPKLISRLQSEGKNSPADLFLTSDVGNLEHARQLGLLAPVSSEILLQNIPAKYRSQMNEGGYDWFGLSLRVRAIFYNKENVNQLQLSDYEDLADSKWRGKILIRSSSNVYNQSLIASLIAANGLKKTEDWAAGLVANFARKPQGGDTDQLRALAAGQGDLAIANSYYYARLLASNKERDRQVAQKIAIFMPNQKNRGAHVNVSGGGVLKTAKNKDNAIKLLEFLSSSKAQKIYADKNHEYPVLSSVKISDIVASFGAFKKDKIPVESIRTYRSEIVKITDRVGWR